MVKHEGQMPVVVGSPVPGTEFKVGPELNPIALPELLDRQHNGFIVFKDYFIDLDAVAQDQDGLFPVEAFQHVVGNPGFEVRD
jgi:hypothetical protein